MEFFKDLFPDVESVDGGVGVEGVNVLVILGAVVEGVGHSEEHVVVDGKILPVSRAVCLERSVN